MDSITSDFVLAGSLEEIKANQKYLKFLDFPPPAL
jgi:hypothetical protein